jgi:tRNA 2-thiouridine synthesizing protein A
LRHVIRYHTFMSLPFFTAAPLSALIVDARGELCPWPLLKTKAALAPLACGALVAVYADDPLAELDLRALCVRAGHTLITASEQAGQLYVLIAKA